jgi:hypothetical protein
VCRQVELSRESRKQLDLALDLALGVDGRDVERDVRLVGAVLTRIRWVCAAACATVTTASGPAYGPKCGRPTPMRGTFISILQLSCHRDAR